jgi:hypothetical protein
MAASTLMASIEGIGYGRLRGEGNRIGGALLREEKWRGRHLACW